MSIDFSGLENNDFFYGVRAGMGDMSPGGKAERVARDTGPTPAPTGDDDDDGGGGGPSAEDQYWAGRKTADDAAAAAKKVSEQRSARAFLNTLLTQYNMGSLAGQVEALIQESTNQDYLAEKVRQTQEYKARFKGLVNLQARGITDIRNEGEYLKLETNYRQVFREAGVSSFLGQSGTQTEYDAIAKLVGDY
jgi:hypothetical protein